MNNFCSFPPLSLTLSFCSLSLFLLSRSLLPSSLSLPYYFSLSFFFCLSLYLSFSLSFILSLSLSSLDSPSFSLSHKHIHTGNSTLPSALFFSSVPFSLSLSPSRILSSISPHDLLLTFLSLLFLSLSILLVVSPSASLGLYFCLSFLALYLSLSLSLFFFFCFLSVALSK